MASIELSIQEVMTTASNAQWIGQPVILAKKRAQAASASHMAGFAGSLDAKPDQYEADDCLAGQ